MLDPNIIRTNPDFVRERVAVKGYDASLVDDFLALDEQRRQLTTELQEKQAERNASSATMATADEATREAARDSLRIHSQAVQRLEREVAEIDANWKLALRQLPNLPAADVPLGGSDRDNVELRTEGEKPTYTFPVQDHEQLLINLDLLDLERGAKAAGSKFYYLKGQLVQFELGLLRWALDKAAAAGFTPMTVPHLLPAKAFYGAGHFVTEEDAENGDAYRLERDDLYLAGTAEVGLVNYHTDEILPEATLPRRYVGISPAYRREAGTYGKENRGLYRVHQFNKVELVSLVNPEESEQEHAKLLAFVEELLHDLGLHYRVVLNCGGDIGHPQVKKWDIECWMAGLNKYGETHSCSNDTDYQARSLGIRYKPAAGGSAQLVHTLNNTAVASPRLLIALLEHYQQENGTIAVPAVLQPYVGFSTLGVDIKK
jgi:seryl-tRNA synthetase